MSRTKRKSKPEPEPVETSLEPLKPGETAMYYCGDCSTNYEICHEPEDRDCLASSDLEPRAPMFCPFCGGRGQVRATV
jgi:hypothetical protein